MKTNYMQKVVLCFLIAGISSSFFGCIRCPKDQFMKIDNAELSLFWFKDLEPDQQYRDYIGIRCLLTASNVKLASKKVQPLTLVKSAYAWSCDTEYYLKDDITSIRVVTLYDISETIEAGAEVTELFLFRSNYGFIEYDFVHGVEDLMQSINTNPAFFDPSIEFDFVSSTVIEGEFAKFELEISFANNVTLTAQTPLIRLADR